MNLNLSDDQLLLRDTVAKLFKTESSPIRVRAAEATGFDAKLWAQLVAIGLPVMRMPESAGGAGLGLLEAVLLAEEAGRHLASVPLAEALVAGRLLAQLGPEAAPWLERVQGGALVTLLPGAIQPGTAQVVNGATVAEALLALDGDTVVLITGAAPEAPQPNLGAAALAPCILGGPGATGTRHVLARGDAARDAFLAAVEEWKLLTAAMLAGLGKQALEMAAAYSRERQQFGRPIGGYQGIAHPLADALTEIEGAQLLVWRAIWSIAEGSDDAAAGFPRLIGGRPSRSPAPSPARCTPSAAMASLSNTTSSSITGAARPGACWPAIPRRNCSGSPTGCGAVPSSRCRKPANLASISAAARKPHFSPPTPAASSKRI